jgi:uncharacterized protein
MAARPRRILCLLFFLAILAASEAFALAVPKLTGRVNDYAAMLSPATRQQLESVLADFERQESTQLAVLTIPSLEGAVLEEYSLQVAESWRLGQKGRDNGALLLIVKNDRKLRIEVGYGLEGKLTDLTSGRIIRDIIKPNFRKGDFDQGVSEGVSAMIAAVRGEFQAEQAAAPSTSTSSGTDSGGLIGFVAIAFFILARFIGKHPWIAGTIGAILAPIIGLFLLHLGNITNFMLIPAGFIAGFLASLLFGNMRFSSGWSIGSSGGFSSGSSGSDFSGGGGDFGGGGSSGDW